MAFAAFFARFALCSTVLFARTVVGETVDSLPANSLHDAVQSACIWECNVVGSEFGLKMNSLIPVYRLITLHLKYEEQVDKKCSNQTDAYNSSIKLAELWTWLTGGNSRHGGQNMTQPSSCNKDSGTWFRKSLEGQIEVGVSCSLRPTKDLNDTQPSLNDLIAIVLMEEVANVAELAYSDTVLCYKLSAKNGSFVCVNKTTITAESIHVSWQQHGFKILAVFISFVLLWYFPAIVCLFAPTQVKKTQGCVNIVLNGTSPISIRSWIANKLSSHNDAIKWKLKLALIFIVISCGFTFVEIKVVQVVLPTLSMTEYTDSLIAWLVVLVVCNILLTIRSSVKMLRSDLSFGVPCLICHVFGDKCDIIHDQDNPEYYGRNEVKMHLRLQPSIVKGLFVRYYSFLKKHLACLSGRLCCPVRWLVLVLLALLFSPVYLLVVVIVLLHSCPLSTFYDMLVYQSRANRRNPKFPMVGYLQLSIVVWTSFSTVVEIANDSVSIIRGSLMRLPNYLPYASLGVVIAYCIWKCYISLPRDYNNLALKLYKHYKEETAKTEGEERKSFHYTQNFTREFPKDLFDQACEKLMPLRESVGILVVRIIAILTGVFVVFAVIMETPGADDVTKAIGTLLAILIPKISEMFFDVNSQVEKLDDETFDKRVESVVDEYLGSIDEEETVANQNASNNNNGGTSAENEERV